MSGYRLRSVAVEIARHAEEPSQLTRMRDRVFEAVEERREPIAVERLTPEQGFDYWCDLVVRRIRENLDCLVLVTGRRGWGKSTLALRMSERVSKELGTEWNLADGLCYSSREVLAFLKRATVSEERGRVMVFDEAVRGLLSVETFDREQIALVRALNLVRESGCVLFICIPDLMSLTKSVRVRLAALWLAVRKKGLARCHVRDETLQYKPESNFGFATSPVAPFLTWRPYRTDSATWRAYQARKHVNLVAELSATEAIASGPSGNGPRGGRTNAERQRDYRLRKKARAAGNSSDNNV